MEKCAPGFQGGARKRIDAIKMFFLARGSLFFPLDKWVEVMTRLYVFRFIWRGERRVHERTPIRRIVNFFSERTKEGRRAAQHLGFWPQKRHTRRSGCRRRRRLNNDPSKKDYCPNMNIRQSPLSPLLSLSHLMPCHTKKWEGMVRQKREENMSCRIGRIKNYDCVLSRKL